MSVSQRVSQSSPTRRAVVPAPSTREREVISDHAYNISGAMVCQRGNLDTISQLDAAGDAMRGELARALATQRRYLLAGDARTALSLNQAAAAMLGQVDTLDAAEDAEPLAMVRVHNSEAHMSSNQIIAVAEGREASPAMVA